MYVPIQKKTLLITGMIFLGLFSTAYLVNSFTGNLALPAAEINFEDDGAKKAAEEVDLDNGYQIPGFYEEDYEYKEISKMLNIPEGTIKSIASRAFKKIKKKGEL